VRDDFDFRADYFVMLFSTDWFFNHWTVLGIEFAPENKRRFQLGCRPIVRDMISEAAEYWLINFSNARVKRTLALLEDLLLECASDVTVDRILSVIRRRGASSREGDECLVTHMTDLLAKKNLPDYGLPPMEPNLASAVNAIWSRYQDRVGGILKVGRGYASIPLPHGTGIHGV
jgi:hypothetical protein